MSDKKKPRMTKAEAAAVIAQCNAKMARNEALSTQDQVELEAVIARSDAVSTQNQNQIHLQGLALLHAAGGRAQGDSELLV